MTGELTNFLSTFNSARTTPLAKPQNTSKPRSSRVVKKCSRIRDVSNKSLKREALTDLKVTAQHSKTNRFLATHDLKYATVSLENTINETPRLTPSNIGTTLGHKAGHFSTFEGKNYQSQSSIKTHKPTKSATSRYFTHN
jgi:hypothetical protein